MKKITGIGNRIIGFIAGLFALALVLYGGLMLRDTLITEVRAFASYDLMQYRPNIEENEPPYLDELMEINPDTTGWITIYNTNIDYPVMQGKNDMEYINKDVYGEYTVTGSIFMSTENAKDYSNPYTLLYGHHMANGSMFGDIPKFKDENFFAENTTGILIKDSMAYDLTVMALLETDAYDEQVYRVSKDDLTEFMDYLRANATNYREVEYEKIIAMSTCNDGNTAGRTILVCGMTERTAALPTKETGEPAVRREAIGHPLAEEHWGLLTLIALMAIVYFTIKIEWVRRKNIISLRNLLVLPVCAASVLFFIRCEDLRDPMEMVDKWTPLMVGALIILRLILIGTREEKDKKEQSVRTA